MDSTDFSFMTTGLLDGDGNYQLSNQEKSQLLAVLVIYMENAIKLAEKYVKYENRPEITNRDIIIALKSQALDHNDIWNNPNTHTELDLLYQEIKTDLENQVQDNQDEDKDEEDNHDEDYQDESITSSKQEENDLTSELEERMKIHEQFETAESRWLDWQPTDPELVVLKQAIDKTEKKFNTT